MLLFLTYPQKKTGLISFLYGNGVFRLILRALNDNSAWQTEVPLIQGDSRFWTVCAEIFRIFSLKITAVNTAGPQRVTLVNAWGEQHSTAIPTVQQAGATGLQKSSNAVCIRSQLSSTVYLSLSHWGHMLKFSLSVPLSQRLSPRAQNMTLTALQKNQKLMSVQGPPPQGGMGVRLMCSQKQVRLCSVSVTSALQLRHLDKQKSLIQYLLTVLADTHSREVSIG